MRYSGLCGVFNLNMWCVEIYFMKLMLTHLDEENRNSKEIKQILPMLGSTAKVKTTWLGRHRV